MPPIIASRPNAYTGSPLDRAGARRDDADWMAAAFTGADARFLPVWRGRSLMRGVAEGAPEAVYLDPAEAGALDPARLVWAFLGVLADQPVFAVDVSHLDDPTILLPDRLGTLVDLRAVAGTLPAADAAILAHARGLMHWRGRHRFCGICGGACEARSAGNVMACTVCASQHFPRTDPAVIMLVTRGDRVLLGHSQRFPLATMYSTLAGFVEPGESLEEAVAREVGEEAGVTIGRVTYHSSQPWPFPSSIMLGFYAEALTEDIVIDHDELTDARWFSRAELADHAAQGFSLPRADSIARRLIEDWIAAA